MVKKANVVKKAKASKPARKAKVVKKAKGAGKAKRGQAGEAGQGGEEGSARGEEDATRDQAAPLAGDAHDCLECAARLAPGDPRGAGRRLGAERPAPGRARAGRPAACHRPLGSRDGDSAGAERCPARRSAGGGHEHAAEVGARRGPQPPSPDRSHRRRAGLHPRHRGERRGDRGAGGERRPDRDSRSGRAAHSGARRRRPAAPDRGAALRHVHPPAQLRRASHRRLHDGRRRDPQGRPGARQARCRRVGRACRRHLRRPQGCVRCQLHDVRRAPAAARLRAAICPTRPAHGRPPAC